jgi:hypothetical protein
MRRFSLRGKGLPNYYILLIALLSVGISIYALVLCIRAPIQKRKWLWIVITILGIGKLGVEWSSGELWSKIPYLSILPLGWGFDSESPFVYASLPAGAILFLVLQRRLLRAGAPLPQTNTVTSTPIADRAESDSAQ